MNGTVRDARGLTSIRYTPSSRTMNWALTRPRAPERQHDPLHRGHDQVLVALATRSAAGTGPTESPEWTPARSTCSSSPGISTSLAVGDGVDVDLDALEVAVDADRAVRVHDRGRRELPFEVLGRVAEVDGEPADHERRPDDDRVADALGERQRLVDAVGHPALRLRDPEPVEQRGEPGPLLGLVDGLEVAAQERHAAGRERRGEVQRRLAAERDDRRQQVRRRRATRRR